jgi:hypothetical protein
MAAGRGWHCHSVDLMVGLPSVYLFINLMIKPTVVRAVTLFFNRAVTFTLNFTVKPTVNLAVILAFT